MISFVMKIVLNRLKWNGSEKEVFMEKKKETIMKIWTFAQKVSSY